MSEKPSANISVGNYLDIVRRRLWVAINTFVIATTIGVIATFMAASIYQARARLLLEQRSSAVNNNNNNNSGLLSIAPPNPIATQIQLLQNPSFLAAVYEKAQVNADSITSITILPVGETNLVDIVVEGREPRALKAVANEMADVHLSREQEAMVSQLQKASAYLEQESSLALKNLGIAERKLAEYRRTHPEVSAPDSPDARGKDLADAAEQLRVNERTIKRLKMRIADGQQRLQAAPENLVRVVAEPNPAVEEARLNLEKLKGQRDQLLKTYPPANPKVRALEDQISEQQDTLNRLPKENKRQLTEPNAARISLANTLSQWQLQLSDAEDARIGLAEDLKRLQGNPSAAAGSPDTRYLELVRDVDTTTKQYMAFNDRLQDLKILERAKPSVGQVVEQATVPGRAMRPQRGFLIAASVLAALVLSLSLVFLLEYFDDSLKWPEELEWHTGLSIMGYNPTIEDEKARLLTQVPGYSITTERYRVLRSNIQFASVDAPLRSLLVTSSVGGEGKSLTSANLAAVFAMEGRRVILIDGDLRKPVQHTQFNVPQTPGLSDLLEGDGSLRDCLRETGTPNLYLLPSGTLKGNPAELVGSRLMDALLDELKPFCDIVIVDSPPCLAVADASLLSTKADATLLVVDFSRAKRHVLRQASSLLARARAHLLGAVLNRADGMRSSAYYGYYYYPYSSYALPETTASNGTANGNGRGERSRLPELPVPSGDRPERKG